MPMIDDNDEMQLFADQLYLFTSISIVLCLCFSITFAFVGRLRPAVLCLIFFLFCIILMPVLRRYPPERTANLAIWGGFAIAAAGVVSSTLNLFNSVMGVFYILLIVSAFFAAGSLIYLGVATGIVFVVIFLIARLNPENAQLVPAWYDLVMVLSWITMSVVYLRYSVSRLEANANRIREQQTQLLQQQKELESYRDDLEILVTQRTAELEDARRQAENAKISAESANHAKSYFLANMSHELRTPLNAIIGYSEIIQETLEEMPFTDEDEKDEVLDDTSRIRRSGIHLLSLINQVLDLSKIEADMMELHLTNVRLQGIVEEIWHIVLPLAEKKQIQLRIDDQANGITSMYTDQTKLSQILVNLLSNAIKFTDEGSVTLRIEPIEHGADKFISMSIADTGIGMSPDVVARVFQPFWQAETTFVRKYAGTGLGLTISKRLCEALGGRLTVMSEVGVGTTFTMVMPVKVTGKQLQENDSRAEPTKLL